MQIQEILAADRINAIYDQLADVRQLPQNLLWSTRVGDQDAEDGEILARINGYVTMADIIADDASAVVRASTPVTTHQIKIPNIKHGRVIKQEQMSILRRLINGNGDTYDLQSFDRYLTLEADMLRLGVLQRKEALIVAMVADDLDYDRLGIKISNLSWGMPSDLKVTPSTAWSNTAATPIADTLAVQRIGREKYGINFDRMSISSAAFDDMISTTEFIAKAQLYSAITFPAGSFPTDTQSMQNLAGRILNMDVEIYDAQTWEEGDDGSQSSVRFLNERYVLLTNKALDGDRSSWDWANAVVLETVAASFANSVVGGFTNPQRGPVGYATVPPDLNPPQITQWSVARGFPRKHRLASSARLSV